MPEKTSSIAGENQLAVGPQDNGDATSSEKLPEEENLLIQDNKINLTSEQSDARGEDNDKKKIEDDDYKALLQDRGWAWFVVLGCFLSHVITGGFERSDGVLFLQFTEKFQESAQLTAWPGALCSSVRLLAGPIATAVSNRFSVRTSVMAGTFIFALGVAVSGLAPSVPYLFFTYGFLQGFGRGLVYAPGVVVVGMYFNRHRGLSTGLGTAGVGLGTFLFPPMVEMLFEQFGFSGAFLMLSGIALHLCIVAALFRPLFIHRSIVIGDRKKKSVAKDLDDLGEERAFVASKEGSLDLPKSTKKDASSITIELSLDSSDHDFQDGGSSAEKFQESPRLRSRSRIKNCCKSVISSCFPVEEQKMDKKKQKLIEWSLLKNPPFLFYCFSICLFTAAFKSAFTFLPALAASSGISKIEAAYLLSISGIVDTIGRVLAGFILDMPRIKPFRPLAYNGIIFVIVVLSFLSPLMNHFTGFAVLFGLYGMMTGAYVSQKSVVIVDILGQEKLTSSFGLLICFQGIGTAIGPPLSGLLRDIYGSFKEAFFMGGAAMAAAGGLMIVSNIYRIVMQHRLKAAMKSTKEHADDN
ncbi:hypothetical protein C0Q70_17977 [Pomacea canaliculata]|uniref:Major facilitator superfamily (MFS) profile domain-containing protein n=2 Tax=Pomacea canaliculata TaxID=400727 RepID=A0A2T7NLX9_POMCA|nr:hypothetical protein C0Q70_17977 [Pomacea canaliculata]